MSFDAAQLSAIAPIVAMVVAGVILLLLEAFASGQSRAYLSPLAVIACVIAFALVASDFGETRARVVFDGLLTVDRLALFLDALFLVAAAFTCLLAAPFLREHHFEHGEFYPLVLFATAGMMILASATDLVTVFLGIETMSIAVYVLVGCWRRSPKSNEAAMKYFLNGAFAAAILLYGIALLYGATGTTQLAVIARSAPKMATQPLFLIGMLLVLAALAFKVAAVPFHFWAPDTYEGAPTPVTAFMAAGVKAAGFAALLRVFGGALARTELEFGSSGWAWLTQGLAVLTMSVGNLTALRSDNVKRMLAYSSIAHAGYLLVGVVALAVVGPEARGPLLFYLAAYTVTTVGAFGVVAWIGQRGDERLELDDWAGLASRHPAVALAMTLFMLSLGGVPPTAGFFAKFYLFRAALEKPEMVPLVVIAVLNSVVSVFYYLRVVTAMYFREVGREVAPIGKTSMHAALLLSALAVLGIGLLPGWLVDLSQSVFPGG